MEEIRSLRVFKLLLFFFLLIHFSSALKAYKLSVTPSGDSSFRWQKNLIKVDCDSSLKDSVESLSAENMALLGDCLIPELECAENAEFDAAIKQPDEWEYGSQVLAITKNRYEPKKGWIIYSLIEVNKSKLGNYPLENTLNHEIGHLLGLEHSKDPDATMYETALPGEVKKASLNSDDINALCYLYSLEFGEVNFDSRNCGFDKSLPEFKKGKYEFYCESVDLKNNSGGCMLIPEKSFNNMGLFALLSAFLLAGAFLGWRHGRL